MRGLDFSPIRFRYVLTLMLMVVLAVTSMVFGEILEVETMAVKTTGHQITDGWLLESEGYVSDSVDFVSSGFYEFTVRAKGHHGDDGWPFLELRVDDVVVGPILVTHTSWHNYSILSEVSSGRHQLTLAYINDSGVRSLSLDRVEILSTTVDEEVWLINLSESILSRFPDPTDYSITSWQVEELMYGMSQSYEVTGDLDYLNYVRSFMDGHVNSNGDLDIEIRDFIPGIILIWLYQATGEQKYLGAAEQVGEYLLTEYPRTSEGGFVHLPRLLDQLWVDTLGGLGRFLGLMGYITGDIRYFNEGVHQILIHASHLQDQVSGLFYHGWDEDGSADWAVTAWNTSAYFWARGNGWVIRGIADFLEYLPESHPQRDAVVAIFTSLADGLLQYQDQSSGLWYTVLDHGDDGGNYLESSGSALFAYGLQKGINIGVLDQSYQDAVHQANNGLYRKFYVQEEVEAIVTGISSDTGPGDYNNYVNKPIGTGNDYKYGDGILLQEKTETAVNPSYGKYNISGHINYYSNDNPIVLAEMSLTGGAQLISSSNSSGYYTFSDLSEGLSYTLKASKASGTDIGIFDITTYDAALTAQAAVGLRILTEHEAIAADVSCDGHVYTYDAALIAQYSVGLPPVSSSHVGEWRFLPDSIDYSSLSGDEVDQDFTGILLGNVHGGWSGGGLSGQPMVYKGYDLLKEYVADTGEQLLITIYLPSSGDVISSDIEFCYDTAVLDFSGIVRTGLLRNVELYYYARDGRIRIGFYSIEPIDQSGELLKLRFRVKGSPGEESELRLARFQINDQVLYRGGSRLVVGDVMPQSYSLGQNYPNPFFPGGTGIDRVTRIKYSLPESGQVRLTIYNYLGQQIKDMAIGEKPAGRYEALWDGRDDLGRAVSAGVYFYRLEADRFIEMRRMVVLR